MPRVDPEALKPYRQPMGQRVAGALQGERKKEKSPDALRNLPIGAVIRCTRSDGTAVELTKHAPAYQFTKPFWYCRERNTYIPASQIPYGYEVIFK